MARKFKVGDKVLCASDRYFPEYETVVVAIPAEHINEVWAIKDNTVWITDLRKNVAWTLEDDLTLISGYDATRDDDTKARDNIKPGMTVWKVHGFFRDARRTFITEHEVLAVPYFNEEVSSYFVNVRFVHGNFDCEISLKDAGFPSGNTYNDHKLFFSKFEADTYANQIIDGKIKSRVGVKS